MPTQPNPNPKNKETQLVFNNEATSYPTYPINTLELDGVQLRSGKALQGPTVTEINESETKPTREPPLPQ